MERLLIQDKEGDYMLNFLTKVLKGAIFTIAILLILEKFIFSLTIVQGMSMNPSINNNDKLFVNKLSYVFKNPEPGDIVIFHPPIMERTRELFIKRVVAVEGDFFSIEDGKLYINGSKVEEPYINNLKYKDRSYDYTKGIVPDNAVFVLGDNRNDSNDSRCFGFVPLENIEGKADLRLWPKREKGFSSNYAEGYQ